MPKQGKKAKTNGSNQADKLFDNTFRTICEKMPRLLIPLVNEVFGTNYPDNAEIIRLNDGHHPPFGKIDTDAFISINGDIYHIECQSKDLRIMIVRMFEYGTAIAIENKKETADGYEIEFPKQCVVYLRGKDKASRSMNIRVKFPDGFTHDYKTEYIEVENYNIDAIYDKNLLLFIPFYGLRHEKVTDIDKNAPCIVEEFDELIQRLYLDDAAGDVAVDLVSLTRKINTRVFKGRKELNERIGDIMGGKTFKLQSEILREEGRAEGREEGRIEAFADMVREGTMSISVAAKKLGCSVKAFKEKAKALSIML